MSKYNQEYFNFLKSILSSFGEMKTINIRVKSREAGFKKENYRKHLRKMERDGLIKSEYDYVNGSTLVNKWIWVEDVEWE